MRKLQILPFQDSDVHISFEDQQKINIFAKHNANIEDLKQELKVKQNALKNLEESNDEIELFDDDEPIPILIGDVFITHNLQETQVRFVILLQDFIY